MRKIKTTRWNSAEYLKTDEDIRLYLEACFEEAGDDAAFIAHALGVVARARGMTQLDGDNRHSHRIQGLLVVIPAGDDGQIVALDRIDQAMHVIDAS